MTGWCVRKPICWRISGTHREQVIDARSAERFAGQGEEPWPHIKKGHIPGSLNQPWQDLLDPETRTFFHAEALAERFKNIDFKNTGRSVVWLGGHGLHGSVRAIPTR